MYFINNKRCRNTTPPCGVAMQVHLCEIDSPQDLVSLEFPFNIRKGRPLLVAVKILRSDATKNARYVETHLSHLYNL